MIDMHNEILVRIEPRGDAERVHDLLGEAVGNEIESYEVVNMLADSSRPGVKPTSFLHLYKVYTIAGDLSESDPVFVMARTEDGAACLFHKARARDQENILCEVIVSKVQDAEVCDE